MDHDPPLHFSISVALKPGASFVDPTAQHFAFDRHVTLTRVFPDALLEFGELTSDQDFPSHRSTSVAIASPVKYCPTAQQRDREAQLTPTSTPSFAPGVGGWMADQVTPFHSSMRGYPKASPLLDWKPTAKHVEDEAHVTPNNSPPLSPRSGEPTMDQVVPFHFSMRVAGGEECTVPTAQHSVSETHETLRNS
jgi:hypothetical protein